MIYIYCPQCQTVLYSKLKFYPVRHHATALEHLLGCDRDILYLEFQNLILIISMMADLFYFEFFDAQQDWSVKLWEGMIHHHWMIHRGHQERRQLYRHL